MRQKKYRKDGTSINQRTAIFGQLSAPRGTSSTTRIVAVSVWNQKYLSMCGKFRYWDQTVHVSLDRASPCLRDVIGATDEDSLKRFRRRERSQPDTSPCARMHRGRRHRTEPAPCHESDPRTCAAPWFSRIICYLLLRSLQRCHPRRVRDHVSPRNASPTC